MSRYTWRIIRKPTHRTVYAVTSVGSKTVYMHKLITGFAETDHKDGNGLNNHRSNLRDSTHTQNMQNRKTNRGTKSSKYKGVSKRRDKWRAYINNQYGIKVALGDFSTEREAALAYNEAALRYHGEYARLNDA